MIMPYACSHTLKHKIFLCLLPIPDHASAHYITCGVVTCTLTEPWEVAADYVVVKKQAFANIYDVADFLKMIQQYGNEESRFIIEAPISWLRQLFQKGYSRAAMRSFIYLAGLEIISERSYYVRGVVVFITRKTFVAVLERNHTVSVIVPCRNEAGNLEDAVRRCPRLGISMEFIFAEGHSRDNSVHILNQLPQKFPEYDISWFTQTGKGKKNAVEEGFARAKGDILMILDGDLTMPPEELSKFYDALISGKGECINGNRLIYPMESGAMNFARWCANQFFAQLLSLIVGQRVGDTLCGTKVFFKKDYKKIQQSVTFFGDVDPFGDFDILCGAAYNNLKILDVPIHYKERTYGTSQINTLIGGFLLLKTSFLVWKRYRLLR